MKWKWVCSVQSLSEGLTGYTREATGELDPVAGWRCQRWLNRGPADLAATTFHLLVIGPHREFHDAQGRLYRNYRSEPIAELL